MVVYRERETCHQGLQGVVHVLGHTSCHETTLWLCYWQLPATTLTITVSGFCACETLLSHYQLLLWTWFTVPSCFLYAFHLVAKALYITTEHWKQSVVQFSLFWSLLPHVLQNMIPWYVFVYPFSMCVFCVQYILLILTCTIYPQHTCMWDIHIGYYPQQTVVNHIILWGSVLFTFIFNYVYTAIDTKQNFMDTYWLMQMTSTRPEFSFILLLDRKSVV